MSEGLRDLQSHDSHQISCKTTNLVYGISCQICGEIVYVGETGTTLYSRIQNHLSIIRRCRDEVLPLQFNGVMGKLTNLGQTEEKESYSGFTGLTLCMEIA